MTLIAGFDENFIFAAMPFAVSGMAIIKNHRVTAPLIMSMTLPLMLYYLGLNSQISLVNYPAPIPTQNITSLLLPYFLPISFCCQFYGGLQFIQSPPRYHRYGGRYHYEDILTSGTLRTHPVSSYSSEEQNAFKREILAMHATMREGA